MCNFYDWCKGCLQSQLLAELWIWLYKLAIFYESTSPSGEKLRAEIAVATDSFESSPSKLGSPGGPLASKTFIAVILYMRWEVCKEKSLNSCLVIIFCHNGMERGGGGRGRKQCLVSFPQ